MKFTNKILDIITSSVMKKVAKKKQDFKSSEEYEKLLEKVKEEKNFGDLENAFLTWKACKEALEKALEECDKACDAYKDMLKENEVDDLGYCSPSSNEAWLENKFNEIALESAEFPTRKDIQTAIIFTNNSDVAEVEATVCKQFNL